MRNIIKYLDAFISDATNVLDDDERYQVEDAIEAFEHIANKVEEKHGLPINRLITNRLEMSVVSVNGNSDRDFIRKYISTMVAKDSLFLRRYILENTPGLDFRIKIEKPESLGGGFIETFLDWNDTVFLSIA